MPVTDARGRAVVDDEGHPVLERVRGTKSVDLTFSAPKSVSIVWSQADPALRREIEHGMLAGAASMLADMTLAKPVVAHRGGLEPASGFAAAAALHVFARASHADAAPAPQLHVHGIVVGVERSDGLFAAPELSGMFRRGAPLEGGAIARLRLAETLADIGFEIVNHGRYFEIAGVPAGLVERLSARARDVESSLEERRRARNGASLTNVERSMAALLTRPAKRDQAPLAATVASWRGHARDFGFGRDTIEAIRVGRGFAEPLEVRCRPLRPCLLTDDDAPPASRQRARFLELAAGRIRLAEAHAVLGAAMRHRGSPARGTAGPPPSPTR
jgi:conjugative relaxase-like TrwC/TraI family protein